MQNTTNFKSLTKSNRSQQLNCFFVLGDTPPLSGDFRDRSRSPQGSSLLHLLSVCSFLLLVFSGALFAADRPNILIAISDDQSYPHASAYGHPVIQTPAFDEIARRGVLFHNAFTPAPGCSPMRAAFLTGQHIGQIREAGTHASAFPSDLITFPDHLEQAGYDIGYTGKPWGPGNFKVSGRSRNPAGPAFNEIKNKAPAGISSTDYAANFEKFLDQRSDDKPFCFWFGGHEPHRGFGKGLGAKSGMNADEVVVPSFLPDSEEVRQDLLDYFFEIQWFDSHLARILRTLEQRGETDNTIVIVTSDNGMAFPRAKANLYEYGIHMPLAISWPAKAASGRSTHALVNLLDVTATIYDVSGVQPPATQTLSGKSLMPLLVKDARGVAESEKDFVAAFSGRERHSSSRYNSLGYPSRCVRTDQFLYIRNFTPERWPAGPGQKYASAKYDANSELVEFKLDREHGGYHDIDACPTLDWMIENRDTSEVGKMLDFSVARRPAEEFFDVQTDPACLVNLANEQKYQQQLDQHRRMLTSHLAEIGDLRQTDFAASHIWETYPRYSPLRWFPKPDWAEQDPQSVPEQPWLEERRPRVDSE